LRMFPTASSALRMHATAATGAVAVHAVIPLSEVPLRVQLATVHSSVPGVRTEPADASVLLSAAALRRPKNLVVIYVEIQ